jgi:hypothetical protein
MRGAVFDRTIMTRAILDRIDATGAHGSLLAALNTAEDDDESVNRLRAAGAGPIVFAPQRA